MHDVLLYDSMPVHKSSFTSLHSPQKIAFVVSVDLAAKSLAADRRLVMRHVIIARRQSQSPSWMTAKRVAPRRQLRVSSSPPPQHRAPTSRRQSHHLFTQPARHRLRRRPSARAVDRRPGAGSERAARGGGDTRVAEAVGW